jgi:hypothetical protein
MRVRALTLIAFVSASAACSRPNEIKADVRSGAVVATVDAAPADAPLFDAAPLVGMPKDLVLGIDKSALLRIGGRVREAGELTVHGACSPTIECVTVSEAELEDLWKLFNLVTRVRKSPGYVSPHSVHRAITARWTGGTRVVSDGADGQIVEEDAHRFDALFDALVRSFLAHRADAATPTP